MTRRTHLAAVLASLVAFAAPTAADAAARAELPAGGSLTVGSPTQLTITVDGEAAGAPPTPHATNATIRFEGQMARTTVINGQARRATSFVYTITPAHTGAVDIAAVGVPTAHGTETTAPVHATATDAPAPASAGTREPAQAQAQAHEPTPAFIRLEVPDKTLYVGQAVPVTIRAYFRAGTQASLLGNPKLTSDAFTLAELSDKPAQTKVELRGVPYLQATWTAVLAPAKPSTGKLAIELPIEIAYRERTPAARRPHRTMRDLFGEDPFADAFGGDPFADAFFGGGDPFAGMGDLDDLFDTGRVIQREQTLRASVGTVTARALPEAGKPAGYAGAVGRFDIALDPIAGEPRVGEPLTVTAHVTGTGNFDRVALTGVAASPSLKTYPVKAAFTAAATGKLAGDKTFTQTIIPTRDGEIVVPPLVVAYFDPIKGAYATAETTPQKLQVAPARGGGTADPGLAASVRDPAMTENRVEPGALHAQLAPRYRDPAFWLLPGGLVLVSLALIGAAWWKRSPRVRRTLAARAVGHDVKQAVRAMDRAAEAGDSVAFFAAARAALQARLGATFSVAPEAITAADIDDHLGARGAAIRAVFEHADAVAYANAVPTTEPLDHWRSVVRTELATLESAP